MRLVRLHLRACGPFTERTLDLAGGQYGLHLIVGPNEAGKSSSRRALRYLFSGFPQQTSDDFLHPYPKLRVGAELLRSDGAELAMLRRKGQKGTNTLRGPDDKTPVAPEEFARFLGGSNPEIIETLLSIDHETLVGGGRDLLKGEGEIGKALFAAGSGIADLREAQNALQAEKQGLYKHRGRNDPINMLLSSIQESRMQLTELQLSSDTFHLHDTALREAEAQGEKLERQKTAQTRERLRLTRLQMAAPLVAKRNHHLSQLAGLGDVPLLANDFGQRLAEVQETLLSAEVTAAGASEKLAELERRLSELPDPDAILGLAKEIEDLQQLLGSHNKAARDRPERELQERTHEHDAKEILKSLGREPDVAQAEGLRVRVDEIVEIQDLGIERSGLIARLQSVRREVEELKRAQDRIADELGQMREAGDPAELEAAVTAARNEGRLEQALAEAKKQHDKLDREATSALSRLTLWKGSLAELENLAIPSKETLTRYDQLLQDVANQSRKAEDGVHEVEAELEETRKQLSELQSTGPVPAEDDLQAARRQREEAWQRVRARLPLGEKRGDPPPDQSTARKSVEDFERRVAKADEVADHLRQAADRVSKQHMLRAKQEAGGARRTRLLDQRVKLEEDRARILGEWRTMWDPLGIRPLTPKEMQAWADKHAGVAQLARQAREQAEAAAEAKAKIERHCRQINGALAKLGEAPASGSESLTDLLARAQRVAQACADSRRRHAELRRELVAAERKRAEALAQEKRAEADLESWQSKWAARMARLGLEPGSSPKAAGQFIQSIQALLDHVNKADEFRRRIKGMDRDAEQFREEVAALAAQVAPALAEKPAEEAAVALNLRLKEARHAASRRDALQQQKDRESTILRQASERLALAKIKQTALCREARCESPEELPQAVERAATRRRLDEELAECEVQLLGLGLGTSLEAVVAEVGQVDPDALGAQVEALEKEIAALDESLLRLREQIGAEKTILARMTGAGDAAEKADQIQGALAQLRSEVQEYAILALASAVLRESIDRYRQKNEGPILARARALFSALTCGAFEDLQSDSDEKNQVVLTGIRTKTKEHVRVEGMSDGARDQLYLALRLASVETFLAGREPIPFVVDDILLNFDNERAAAALRVLGELSQKTQVLFFTHHEHLADLAREVVPKSALFIQGL